MHDDFLKILDTEFSNTFVEAMKSRMIVGHYRYGKLADGYPHKINAIASLNDRLRAYARTGNTEFLIDAANFAMIEFMHPSIDGAKFTGTDEDASPGRRVTKTGVVDKRDNATVGSYPYSKTAQFR
jgi:hypothetical protein